MLSGKELARKVVHILVGVLTVLLIYFEILSPLAIFLLIVAGIIISFLSKRIRLPIISFCLDKFERKEFRHTFPGRGAIFFLVGVLLVVQLFDKNIALASIMVLTLGDSVSHMIGKQFGQIKNILNADGKKLLEGTLAGTLAGFLGALIFVPLPEAFFGSFAAMIAEVIQIDFNKNSLDDNVVVPLVAGTIMFLVSKYLPF